MPLKTIFALMFKSTYFCLGFSMVAIIVDATRSKLKSLLRAVFCISYFCASYASGADSASLCNQTSRKTAREWRDGPGSRKSFGCSTSAIFCDGASLPYHTRMRELGAAQLRQGRSDSWLMQFSRKRIYFFFEGASTLL